MRTGTWRERGFALGIVLGWHMLVGWWLLQRLPLDQDGDAALEVVYVSLPPPAPPAPVAPAARRAASSHGRGGALPARPVTAAADAEPAPPGGVAILAQALDMVRREAAPEFRSDPFADRPVRLPGKSGGRFRMKRQVSPADVVVGIGAFLFYPPGYEADQCPRNGRNLANLLAAGDSPELREAVEYERHFCRP